MSDIAIVVNGKTFLGWKDVLFSRSLEALCATFSLSYIDAWEFQKNDGTYGDWYLKPGDACEVTVDDELLLTGYIDSVETGYDAEERRFSVKGRDKTADLVDGAAAINNFKSYQNLDLGQIAAIIVQPYGIAVRRDADVGKKFRQISIEHGQTVFDLLDTLSKQRGVLLTTDNAGRLLFTTPGAKRASVSLEEGDNILSASLTLDHSKRFSKYVVYGQAFGDTQWKGEQARIAKSTVNDLFISRYRPRVIVTERDATPIETQKRAEWEAKFNAAKSVSLQVTVLGWRQGELAGDPLWEPNMVVYVNAPGLGIKGEMLIESVTMRLTESGGEVTELSITRPDAYVPNPTVKEETKQFIQLPTVR